jgi:hypothetical protein
VWLSIPVMVFAFSHTPIISTFAIDRREKYGEQAMGKCKKIMKVAYLVICLSVLFFVFSCLMSIPPSYINAAQKRRRHHPFCAVDGAKLLKLAVYLRYYCGGRGNVEVVPRHLFWGD